MEEKELEELQKTKKLTPKQEMFCQEFVNTLNQTEAYCRAYGTTDRLNARKMASKLMTNIDIKARVDELRAEIRERVKIDREQILEMAFYVYEEAKKGKPEVKMNREGKFVPTGQREVDYKAMNDALKNIAGILGLNSQTVKAEVQADVKANVVSASDIAKELMKDD